VSRPCESRWGRHLGSVAELPHRPLQKSAVISIERILDADQVRAVGLGVGGEPSREVIRQPLRRPVENATPEKRRSNRVGASNV
jgi:hypothetical protein